MTQIAQTPPQSAVLFPARAVAGIALAAALVGGILGGALQALNHPAPAAGARTISARDQVVLQAAQDWEARYRQMYPTSVSGGATVSPRDQVVLQAAQDWEARYRQMYPSSR
jgi:hypothetical protein